MSEQNKALIRRLFAEDISPGNSAVATEIIHLAFHDHTNPPGMERGLDGHNAIVALFKAAFPDMWWQIHEMIAEGDRVVVRTTMEATHQGDFFGIPPTGTHVSVDGVHILRIADGKIAEHWGNNDDLGLMRQLGVIPSPESVSA
jgi:steroid delta-isomerase-like uncharacterized protein